MKTKKILEGLEYAKNVVKVYEGNENPFLLEQVEKDNKFAIKALQNAINIVQENKKLRKENEELKKKISSLEFELEYPDGWTM